jgi:hypothetical protein
MTGKTITFTERAPTSVKWDKTTGSALAIASIYIIGIAWMFPGIAGPIGFFSTILIILWVLYFGYRYAKRMRTTVALDGPRLTVSRTSILPMLSKSASHQLEGETTVAMESSEGWWLARELPFMDGDDPKQFIDITLVSKDANGIDRYVLISRDRATKDVMLARRQQVERLLQGS